LLGNGDGTFLPQLDYTVGSDTVPGSAFAGGSVVTIDYNGDGKPDLVTPYGIEGNNGDGTFREVQPLIIPAEAVGSGDLNSDGRPDVLQVYSSTQASFFDQVNLLLNDPNPTESQLAGSYRVFFYFVGSRPVAVATGDFNRDGKLDLVTVNSGLPTT